MGNCQNQKIRDMKHPSFMSEKIQEKRSSIQELLTFKWTALLGFSVRKPELAFLRATAILPKMVDMTYRQKIGMMTNWHHRY